MHPKVSLFTSNKVIISFNFIWIIQWIPDPLLWGSVFLKLLSILNVLRITVWSFKYQSLCIVQTWRILLQRIKDLQTIGKAGGRASERPFLRVSSWNTKVGGSQELMHTPLWLLHLLTLYEGLANYGPWEKSATNVLYSVWVKKGFTLLHGWKKSE